MYLLGRYESYYSGKSSIYLNDEHISLHTFSGGYRYFSIVFKAEYTIVDLKNGGTVPSAIENLFEVNLFKLAAGFFEKSWTQNKFKGSAEPPIKKDSKGEVFSYVSLTPCAIGYVSLASVMNANVKKLMQFL